MSNEDDCSAADSRVFDTSSEMDTIDSELGFFGSFRCTEHGVICDGGRIAREPAEYSACEPAPTGLLWHPDHYRDALAGLKHDAVVAATIAAEPMPFEVFLDADGAPELGNNCPLLGYVGNGVRLDWFARSFGGHGASHTVCTEDHTAALSDVAARLAAAVASPCIDDPVDVDTCLVAADGEDLPRCPGERCWAPSEDHPICAGGTLVRVQGVPAGAVLAARCVPLAP